jgi:hypothetical protein
MRNLAGLIAVAAVTVATAAAGQFVSKYQSIDELPEADRPVFRREYTAFKDVMARISRENQRIAREMPEYEYARQKLDKATRRSDSLMYQHTAERDYYKQKGPRAYSDYDLWLTLQRMPVEHQVAAELLGAPSTRRYVDEFALFQFQAIACGKRPPPEDWDLAEGILPKDRAGLSPAEAGRLWVEWARLRAERARPALQRLEASVKPHKGLKTWAAELAGVRAVRPYYDYYVQIHRPQELTDATKESGRSAARLSRLWPGWQQPLHEAEYTLNPPFTKAQQDAVTKVQQDAMEPRRDAAR